MKFRRLGMIATGLAAMTMLPGPAMAAPTYSGLNTIQYVVTYQSGLVTFTLGSGTISSPWAACNSSHSFTINTVSISGRAIFEAVIRAQQGLKNVYVVGTGNCTLLAGTEDVNFVQINP
jgi:hypothetical protein